MAKVFRVLLTASPQLARASFQQGATRQSEEAFFLDQIGRYIYAGDTALHIAAAAYQTEIVRRLIAAGADVRARKSARARGVARSCEWWSGLEWMESAGAGGDDRAS